MTSFVPTPTASQINTMLKNFVSSIMPAGVPVVLGQVNRVAEPKAENFVVFTPLRRERLETNIDTYNDCAFTGSINGLVLTVDEITTGTVTPGNPLYGAGVAPGTIIGTQATGEPGQAGTYAVSISQIVSTEVMACGQKSFLSPTKITYQIDFHGPQSADNASTFITLFRDAYAVDQFANQSPTFDVTPLYADDSRQTPFLNDQQQIEYRYSVDACLQANFTLSAGQQFADVVNVTTVDVEAAYPLS